MRAVPHLKSGFNRMLRIRDEENRNPGSFSLLIAQAQFPVTVALRPEIRLFEDGQTNARPGQRLPG